MTFKNKKCYMICSFKIWLTPTFEQTRLQAPAPRLSQQRDLRCFRRTLESRALQLSHMVALRWFHCIPHQILSRLRHLLFAQLKFGNIGITYKMIPGMLSERVKGVTMSV